MLGFELFLCCRQQVGELACVVVEFKFKSIGIQYVMSLLYTLRDLLRKKWCPARKTNYSVQNQTCKY